MEAVVVVVAAATAFVVVIQVAVAEASFGNLEIHPAAASVAAFAAESFVASSVGLFVPSVPFGERLVSARGPCSAAFLSAHCSKLQLVA